MFSKNLYYSCCSCPRKCSTNRNNGELGFCKEISNIKLAWAGLHFGEEPLITVKGGSGAIFVSGCNLQCSFCQNYQISQKGLGKILSIEEFVLICLSLQEAGAENINIVTGSHAVPFLAQALTYAKKQGLKLPICWNSSAYETIESLEMLKGIVDIWLPDLKSLNPLMSQELFKAKDYPRIASRAIKWMINNTPIKISKDKMLSGVIMRHLILPGRFDDSKSVIEWFSQHATNKTYLSLMTQYTPVQFNREDFASREVSLEAFQNRYVEQDEFEKMQTVLHDYNIENGFFQELIQDSSWLPDFNHKNPFSSDLAKTIWHWTD
ncbi:MAG: radical SAM protein [Treponemataceae bacterium]